MWITVLHASLVPVAPRRGGFAQSEALVTCSSQMHNDARRRAPDTRLAARAASARLGRLGQWPRRPPSSGTGGYSAKDLAVLEGLEAVRKRPGMYIGSNDGRGLMHCLWEIVDNAVDEALAGHCKQITVTLHPDGSVEVEDDGRGIPVDVEPKTKLTGVEVVMTKLHAGGKFGGGSYNASGGLHGVGASVVNALSSRLDVEVDRGGKVHMMAFRRGVPGIFDGDDETAAFTKKGGLQVVGKCARTKTGTRVRWWADRQVFTKDADYDREALRDRAMQTTFLVPGLIISLHDNRDAERPVGGDLPAQGRHRGVRGVPVARRGRHLGHPAQRPGPLPRDRAGARRQGAHDAPGGRAGARRRHRPALGHRLRHDAPLLRQRHRHPQGRHARGRVRAGHRQGDERPAAGGQGAARQRGQHRQGRRPRGPHGRGGGAAGRAAVRGPDQGGPGHARGVPDRGQRRSPRSSPPG